MKRKLAWFLLVLMLASVTATVAIAAVDATFDSSGLSSEVRSIQFAELSGFEFVAEDYIVFDYKEFARYPENHLREKISLSGKALQVLGSRTETYQIRLATSGGYGDVVYLVCTKDPGFGILVDDELTVYGRFLGMYSYETVLGSTTTIPAFFVDSISLTEKKTGSVVTGSGSATVKANETTETTSGTEFSVINEYKWETRYYNYLSLIVRNDTTNTVEYSARIILKDKDGAMIGVKNASQKGVGPGCEAIITLSNDEAFEAYEYEIEYSIDKYYKSILQDLEVEVHTTSTKAILSVKNNGSIAAKFVEAHVFFMNGDQIVMRDTGYLTDKDFEIKPGKTEMQEFKCSDPFDSVRVYFEGYGS